MKTKSIDEAKGFAKTQSLDKQYKDVAIYIIHCNRTGHFYVDTNSLIRLWEQLLGYYVNGVYTSEKKGD
ncbi:DNA-binding protein [Galbibacter sp. EGI 63066]|uniref:DNA-binding protein n=1 Tax=Galbibacter sp. EGI 63066 TaxID=2993559 RepID=UPI0022491663|nr:DNA-binding protein [Galbibacter sp. EGI 63066]MCX2680733.1 DNA-binding protein [Galbibacter sp. EGI 63066]